MTHPNSEGREMKKFRVFLTLIVEATDEEAAINAAAPPHIECESESAEEIT